MSFGTFMALLCILHFTSYSYITISCLEKTNVHHLVILLQVLISTIARIGISFCIRLSNFIQIGPSSVVLWCYIDFQDGGRWGAILLPVSDWLMFLSPTSLSSISKPNFAAIAQSTSDLYLNPVWKNKRPPYWNSTLHFSFDFDHMSVPVLDMSFCIWLPDFIQIGPPSAEIWCYIDFQGGSRCGPISLPVSDWLTSFSWEGSYVSANQIS